jgi:hypothetical protein
VYNSILYYLPSQGQLQTRRSVDTCNYIMDKYNIKSKTNYWKALKEKNILIQKGKQTIKQTKMTSGNKNMITKNYITQNIGV